jgi:hypothetical protein
MEMEAVVTRLRASEEGARSKRETAARSASAVRVCATFVQELVKGQLADPSVQEALAKITPYEAAQKTLELAVGAMATIGIHFEKEATACEGELRLLRSQLAELGGG